MRDPGHPCFNQFDFAQESVCSSCRNRQRCLTSSLDERRQTATRLEYFRNLSVIDSAATVLAIPQNTETPLFEETVHFRRASTQNPTLGVWLSQAFVIRRPAIDYVLSHSIRSFDQASFLLDKNNLFPSWMNLQIHWIPIAQLTPKSEGEIYRDGVFGTKDKKFTVCSLVRREKMHTLEQAEYDGPEFENIMTGLCMVARMV